ncbi:Bug family tripartite tricarboxylate transporter substrate binding protein [Aquabacter spiritensis]|uniref:Tripartite-type tricarboxylate transporter receptor subunit TctC n=1 Tax=Aquabacter spiritensis TaxID=933073 RepID=A0A4R3LY98_9HYPH|nr:tripartite tricarboxylate transporter substrate binding protein [Aquabacter spiritensis]TCT05196.1 tripartite-type tricarboxylate transporter receptor subunit TctC [Aquabacter spiritensis]
MTVFRRRFALAAAGAALVAALAFAGPAKADYPDRAVKIVVPFAAGGGVDLLARVIAAELQKVNGQPFVVENRGGAGGSIGIGAVVRAQPDGYTLLITSDAVVTNPAVYSPPPFDPTKDLAAITELGTTPNLITLKPDSPIRSLSQLITESKAQPEKYTYGSGAQGASPHLMVERLQKLGGFKLLHVPFPGAGPATQAVLAGTTDMNTGSYSSTRGQIASGQLRVLFHAGAKRLPDLPDVPTLEELGFPGFVAETFMAMFAPAGTDPAIIKKLSDQVIAILNKPEVRAGIEKTGLTVHAEGPAALTARVAKEVVIWREVVKEIGLKLN